MLLKCHYCKDYIEPQDLCKVPKKDRQGNKKLKKNGEVEVYNCHLQCANERNNDFNGFNDLTSYVQSKYFNIKIPDTFFQDIRILHKNIDYKNILGCLKYLEENLENNMKNKEFNSSTQKGNYIMAALRNTIDTYVEKQKKLKLDRVVEQNELNNTVQLIDKSLFKKPEQEIEDYDFLD